MSVEAELLAAIAAAPEDDGPRLVYADHLLQRGELRGELIGLQCALAIADALDRPCEDAMVVRERELHAEHAARWTLPQRSVLEAGYQLRRGFVEHVMAWSPADVTLADEAAPDRLAAVMGEAPLLRSLCVPGEALARLLPPSWSKLHALHLTEVHGRHAVIRPDYDALVGAFDQLRALRRFHLTSAALGDEQATALLRAAPALEHLGIHLGWHIGELVPHGEVITRELVANPALRALRSLHLAGIALAGVERLAELPHLERLSLDRCRVAPGELISLVSRLPALTMLEYQFHDTEVIGLDLAALLAAAPGLRRLAISGVRLASPETVVQARGLRRVILEHCAVGDRAARAILEAPLLELRIVEDDLTEPTERALGTRALRYQPVPPDPPPQVVECMPTQKVMAVKAYRGVTGAGLAAAKMAVERFEEERTGRPAFDRVRAQSRWCRP